MLDFIIDSDYIRYNPILSMIADKLNLSLILITKYRNKILMLNDLHYYTEDPEMDLKQKLSTESVIINGLP